MYRSLIFILLIICASHGATRGQSLATASAPATRNSEPSDEAKALRALLEEVRLLRVALERSQRDTLLFQATVEHLRLQQQVVHRLDQKLDNCRSELAAIEAALARLPEYLSELERRLSSAEDATTRTLLESELKAAQLSLQEQKESANQRRQLAELLRSQLSEEKQKLDHLFDRFSRFERLGENQSERN
jgi:hypothetical protein